jgi:hypothetical protein
MLSELLCYLSWLLISFGVFSSSGGTETELAASVDALDGGNGLALVVDRQDWPSPLMRTSGGQGG